MSVEAISWAFGQKVGRSSAKSVLVAMANCADPDMVCWPSMRYLEDATDQDRKTVIENIKRLKELGFIAATDARKGRTGQVVVYVLKQPENGTVEQARKRNSSENGTVPFFPSKSPVFPRQQSRKRDTEPKGTQKKHQSDAATRFVLPDDMPSESWDAWVEMRAKIKKPLTDRAMQLAVKKLRQLREQGHAPADVLDQSTLNDWQDLYAIKTGSGLTAKPVDAPWGGAR